MIGKAFLARLQYNLPSATACFSSVEVRYFLLARSEALRTNYILIDYQNVQPSNLALLRDRRGD
jgi:hypothetical protein